MDVPLSSATRYGATGEGFDRRRRREPGRALVDDPPLEIGDGDDLLLTSEARPPRVQFARRVRPILVYRSLRSLILHGSVPMGASGPVLRQDALLHRSSLEERTVAGGETARPRSSALTRSCAPSFDVAVSSSSSNRFNLRRPSYVAGFRRSPPSKRRAHVVSSPSC